MSVRDAAATLRVVSALRALCLALPHVPTPAELDRLRRFEQLVMSPESAGHDDIEAMVAGWREWWRRDRTDDLLAMANRLPPSLVQQDRRLASYLLGAQEVSRSTDAKALAQGEAPG
jgi:hypothetical protein